MSTKATELLNKMQAKDQVEDQVEEPKLENGQVKFETDSGQALSAYVGIKRVTFPYVTSNSAEITELEAFAEHYNTVDIGPSITITKGE